MQVTSRIAMAANEFVPTGRAVGIVRSVLAMATFLEIASTPSRYLFFGAPDVGGAERCGGISAVSIWCMAGREEGGSVAARTLSLIVLAIVASGYRPRWLGIPHWFVTFSLTASMTQPDGGDHVASIATLLLVPLSLGDGRTWHWLDHANLYPPLWRGSAYAAWLCWRWQMIVIYVQAAGSKLAVPQWRSGSALTSVAANPDFGFPAHLHRFVEPLLANSSADAVLAWGVLGIELSIACCALIGRRARSTAAALAIVLHGAIALAMGLVVFSLVMIAFDLVLWIGPRQDTSADARDRGSILDPLRLSVSRSPEMADTYENPGFRPR